MERSAFRVAISTYSREKNRNGEWPASIIGALVCFVTSHMCVCFAHTAARRRLRDKITVNFQETSNKLHITDECVCVTKAWATKALSTPPRKHDRTIFFRDLFIWFRNWRLQTKQPICRRQLRQAAFSPKRCCRSNAQFAFPTIPRSRVSVFFSDRNRAAHFGG